MRRNFKFSFDQVIFTIYKFQCHILKKIMWFIGSLKKVIYQIDTKWTVAPFSKFYDKTWVVFSLNIGERFFLRGFILTPTERAYIGSSKKWHYRDFQNSFPFEGSACFCVTVTENFENVFNALTWKQSFWKNKNVSQNTLVQFLSWKY